MKNFLRPLGLALAFMMLTAGAYAVASGVLYLNVL